MKKKYIIIIMLLPLIIWSCSLMRCEINTVLHGNEFIGEFEQTNMIGGNPIPKVLNYSKDKAKIYYVDEAGGDVLIFEKKKDKWILKDWKTIWSKSGSADGFLWPYIR